MLANFNEVLFSKTSDFLVNYRNSLVVGLASTALCLVVATLAAWSLHRMRWPRWVVHVFLGWALVFHMMPPITLAGAWFTMARAVGLDSTLLGLVLAHTVLNLPMALWLMGIYVRDVPVELEEAARIDGASTPTLLWRIVVPLVAPGLAAAGGAELRVQLERIRRGAQPHGEGDRDGAGGHRQVRPGLRDPLHADGGEPLHCPSCRR